MKNKFAVLVILLLTANLGLNMYDLTWHIQGVEIFKGATLDLSQWAALITAIATAVLAIYAGLQIWLMRKDIQESKLNRSATLLLSVIGTMSDLRDKWHELYGLPPDHCTWNTEQKQLADKVGVELQRIAYLAEMGLIDEKYLLENYARVFAKSWKKLEGFIKDYRKDTGAPNQRIHLERFAKKCGDYVNKYETI